MANHKLETLGVIGLLAGEIFILHPNIEQKTIEWTFLICVWLLFAIISGFLLDKIYNKLISHEIFKHDFLRFLGIIVLGAFQFLMAYLLGGFLF